MLVVDHNPEMGLPYLVTNKMLWTYNDELKIHAFRKGFRKNN